MRDFSFQTPTKVIFGKKVARDIGTVVSKDGVRKVMMICGGNSLNHSLRALYESIEDDLTRAGIQQVRFWGVAPNPSLEQAKEAIAIAKRENVDAVLAVGGGSVIDTAKCVAAGALAETDVWDFYMGKERIREALPIYTVLTVSGTGSENNGNSVISDKDGGIKKLLVSPKLYPRVSFVDPLIQKTVPAVVFSACCADAFSHILEQYLDGGEELEISDRIAEALMRTLVSQAPVVLENPDDYEARAAVMWTSSLAMNGVPALVGLGGKGGDWSTHNLETGVSILKNTMHGTGLAILTPAWLNYVKTSCEEKLARLESEVFGKTEGTEAELAEAAISDIKKYFASINCPVTLSEIGVKESDIDKLVNIISVFTPMGRLQRLNDKDVKEILTAAL